MKHISSNKAFLLDAKCLVPRLLRCRGRRRGRLGSNSCKHGWVMRAHLQRCVGCCGGRSLYLVFWGVAYLKRKWDIWEGCRSLVTPGGDSGSSPHLKHTESAHTDDGGWGKRGGGVGERGAGGGQGPTTKHWSRARVQMTETWHVTKYNVYRKVNNFAASRIHLGFRVWFQPWPVMEIQPVKWLRDKSRSLFTRYTWRWD